MDAIRLRDGRVLHTRLIRPDDAKRLADAFARLSPETRYRRFLTAKSSLSRSDARYLVDVDDRDHLALVATPEDAPEQIVAVARFVRLASDPGAAEFSIVIGDGYQRAGLGITLMNRIGELALGRGIERFTGTILAENEAAHRLVARVAAAPPRWRNAGVVDEVEFALTRAALLAA